MQLKLPTEHQEQKTFFAWCLRHCEEYEDLDSIYAIPNGGNRDAITGKHLKEEGLRAGIPDMFLPVARKGLHGLYVEMKTRKGGKISDKQAHWLKRLKRQGYQTTVCEGFGEARKTIMRYYDEKC